jgi:hypothetical protein
MTSSEFVLRLRLLSEQTFTVWPVLSEHGSVGASKLHLA